MGPFKNFISQYIHRKALVRLESHSRTNDSHSASLSNEQMDKKSELHNNNSHPAMCLAVGVYKK